MTYAPRIITLACLATAVGTTGCKNKDGDGRGGSCELLLAGDLVISEIMSNPAGTDSGNEWFEIYNATSADIGLAGITLVHSQPDGDSQKAHQVEGLLIPAGGFGVVGSVINDPELLPSHVNYGYGGDLGDLRNDAGRLVIACGDTVIDDALYEASGDGASRIYTGDRTPDAAAADDLNFWCNSSTPFGTEEFATPGAANDVCENVGSATECVDESGEVRAVVPPGEGGVVISEFMSNPSAVGDAEGEWIEIYFAEEADLNGLEISKDDDDAELVLSTQCRRFAAGTYAVIARSTEDEVNGGLPRVDGVFDFSLGNSNGNLSVGYGGTVLDTVTWTGSGDGEATQLDPDFLSPSGNDNEDVFCDAVTPYGAGDLGTPGSANDQCEIPAPEGECFEGDGSTRPVVTPAVGDVVITEFHSNPDAVEDADGEWIEVRANGSFDLNGLLIRRDEEDDPQPIEGGDCIPLTDGSYAVIARERDGAVNGGLPQVDAVFGQSLVNSNGRLSIETADTVLDIITWTSSDAGVATQLAPGLTDPEDNDDEANWCAASTAYGGGDFGSPGADNPACGGVSNGMCTDGDSERAIAAPSMGDLVITEVMANPDAVGDSDGEWFEVKNTSGGAVDLNGLQMGFDDGDSSAALPGGGDCISVDAGDYAVLVGNAEMATNGGLPEDSIELGFSSLGNSSRSLWIGYDETHWDDLVYPDAAAGVASSVDPDAETTDGNDIAENICDADTPYGDGDLGTPGAAGPVCPGSIGDGQCLDGGNPRDIVSPAAGDLVITEWMA
ncbi:MAG: lamin tail domain-containing protein, partial [Myxococcota bacterium]